MPSSGQKNLQNSTGKPSVPGDLAFLHSFSALKHSSAETSPSQSFCSSFIRGVMFADAKKVDSEKLCPFVFASC